METYRTWLKLFELQKYYSWIIDRFHISTKAYQSKNHGKEYDFRWLEEGLNNLGFHLVFCTRSPTSFFKAREERLKVSGNPKQYDNIQIFIEEQDFMRSLIQNSILPVLEVDVSDNDINKASEKIADWLELTGGLYAK
jgi:thymidylate kinase